MKARSSLDSTIDTEAEAVVVTGMVLGGKSDPNLSPDHFGNVDCRKIFAAIRRLEAQGKEVDLLTVLHETQMPHDVYYEVIDDRVMTGMLDYVPQIPQLERKHQERQIRSLSGLTDLAEFKARAAALDCETKKGSPLRPLGRIAHEWLETLELKYRGELKSEAVPTGFPTFDRHTGGLEPSRLIVIAARPNVGKTAILINMLCHAASRKVPCSFFSLEMTETQVMDRIASQISQIDNRRLKDPRGLTKAELEKISGAMTTIQKMPLRVDSDPALTVPALRERILSLEVCPKVVAVDYLQIMRPAQKGENRNIDVGEMSAGLKALTKELNIPIVVLAQLNRNSEHSNRLPRLSDLRESGSVEAEADVVAFLHDSNSEPEEAVTHESSESKEIDLIIGKNRDGARNIRINLDFWPAITRFIERDEELS